MVIEIKPGLKFYKTFNTVELDIIDIRKNVASPNLCLTQTPYVAFSVKILNNYLTFIASLAVK